MCWPTYNKPVISSGDQSSRSFEFYVPMLRAHAGYLSWITLNGVGMEIQDLIDPKAAPGPMEDLATFWTSALSGVQIPLSFHGPHVMECLCRNHAGNRGEDFLRLSGAMDVASRIGARFFILHPQLGSMPEESWNGEALDMWKNILQEARARNLVLLLENSDEDHPEILRRLFDLLGEEPGFCLDVGHAFHNSPLKCEEWLERLGNVLRYVHLYNTESGTPDTRRALGDGELDLDDFLEHLGQSHPGIPVCLEIDVPQILASVPWLSARGLFSLKSFEDGMF